MKVGTIQRIICYDFNELNYSSFFLSGLFENCTEFGYQMTVTKKVPELLTEMQLPDELRAILPSIALFKVQVAEGDFFICIDMRDSADPNKGLGYHLPLLDKVKFYFKVNFNEETIERSESLRPFKEKIVPVPLLFPVQVPKPWLFWPRLGSAPGVGWSRGLILARVKSLLSLRSLDRLRSLRSNVKDIDLFFVPAFYGSPHLMELNDFRFRLMQEIKRCGLKAVMGFASKRELPQPFEALRVKYYLHPQYLNMMSRAKVGIYVRGVHDCLSFKLGQLLALGIPVIGQKLYNNKNLLYSNEYFQQQFHFEDPEQIVYEICELLKKPDKCRQIGLANLATFESKYTPKIVTADILRHMSQAFMMKA